ncbi:thiamine diphosphokinase [Fuscibacter oryzae]|uniref:thiamine diphosphokinase n=1 Tax=Fuscibacter oryzae TaxID=2803939 RepID=UPI001F210605|nr:thiamine diphosphokinase [Fuscibacter oryzae]
MNSPSIHAPIVETTAGVILAGGAPFSAALLARAQGYADEIIAADGGADRLLRLGVTPRAVIGDLDSISAAARARLSDRLFPISEQVTTDFDKALRSVMAPYVLALGFQGARLDHGLAVLNTLVRYADRRVLVLGPRDVTFHAPGRLKLTLPIGTRLSLFPMAAVTGRSTGLRWPIDGLEFAPDGMIGTSNEVSEAVVRLEFDGPGMLVILPVRQLPAVLMSLCPP